MKGAAGAGLAGPVLLLAMLLLATAACSPTAATATVENAAGPLQLPAVTAMTAAGQRLQVVATTSIIGDVVGQVGGEAIDLTVLMQAGQDPHSYQPGAADLTAAAGADLIFVNGWNLEEGLVSDLAAIGRDAVLVPVSAGITPRVLNDEQAHDEHDEHEQDDEDHEAHAHGPVDPHVWQDVANVVQWVENIRHTLAAADPANAARYEANAAAYRQTLQQLDADLRATLAGIPPERRVLVTNHDNLGYFAAAYDFEVVGTIIPSVSALAEPSAGALAALVHVMRAEGICTLILETTAAGQLARTLENELTDCAEVRAITLYTDALGPAGSGADSYESMMRANAAALVEGLSR